MAEHFEAVGDESRPVGQAYTPVDEDPDYVPEPSPEEMGLEAPEENSEPQEATPDQEPEPEEPEAEAGEGEGEPEGEPEGQPEGEADPAPVAAAEPEPEEHEPVKVPKARLDKVLRDKRALENRIELLEQQLNKPAAAPEQQPPVAEETPAAELVSHKAIAEALLDGDMEKYVELSAKREEQLHQRTLEQVNTTVPAQVSEQQRRAAFDSVKDDLESTYDVLDPNSDNFDQELVNTVSGFACTYADRGYTPADALAEAAEKVLRVEKPELFQQAAPAPATPNPKLEKLKKERMNIDKKLAAAQQQPPELVSGDVKVDPVPDFENMAEEDFDKLSDTQLNQYMKMLQEQA